MRGDCAPSGASRQTWLLLPPGGRSAPPTPGDFPVAGKVTKGAPRAAPFGIPWYVVTALFALAALRSGSRRATFSHKNRPICHFEFVSKSVLFFPLVPSEKHFLLSIRGAAGSLPPRMPWAFLPSTNTARAQGRGIKGGEAPFAGGPGTRRSLAYLCLLSLREKVGRGAGRSARI